MDEAAATPHLKAITKSVRIASLACVGDCKSVGVRWVLFAPGYLSLKIEKIVAISHGWCPWNRRATFLVCRLTAFTRPELGLGQP
jgi:hypothetical protein